MTKTVTDDHEKRTEKNLIVRSGISEAETTNNTRSSAVAERPRDVSCLSVVSFNIPTAQFFNYYTKYSRSDYYI